MSTRYHMHKNGLVVEHYYKATLESIRRADARFKGARINHVLQLRPDLLPVGVVYHINGGAA